jgi:asparagine synthase (glutamine-hydrolysing)
MCGIAGVVFGAPLEDPIGLGRALTGALRHRGPDAQGWAELPGRRGLLAHTRLSIIDLSDRGRQPMWTPDGAVALAFNGEIYDFQPLRAGLEARGVRFRSDSDTEVILQQYLVHGADGLDALDGMFALALYDARSDRLLLMRDRTGKKPLYWTRTASGALAFASEAKALAPIPGVTLSPEPAHLAEYLTFGYVGTPRSAFQGVHRLPPAHRMVCAAGGPPALTRYWQLPPPPGHPAPHLGARGPGRGAGDGGGGGGPPHGGGRAPRRLPLGGRGLQRHRGRDGPPLPPARCAPSAWASKTMRPSTSGVRQERLRSASGPTTPSWWSGPPPPSSWSSSCGTTTSPTGTPRPWRVYAVSKATRAHVTVVLTGDGGDEVFAGYTRFAGGLAAERVPEAVSRGLHEILGRLPSPRGYKNPLALAQRFVAHAGRSKDEQLLAYNTYFAGPALQAILRPEVAGPGFDPWAVMGPQLSVLAEARAGGADRLDQLLRHNLATYLLDDLLVKTDRMTMAVALEARSPFLDTALMASAFTLPSALKLRGRTLKWLLKEAYRGVLPDGILDRKKHGFGVPVGTWWNGEARAMVDDLLVADGARSAAYLDPVAVRRLVAEHRSGRRDHGQRIFALLQLELWLRRT